MLILLASGMWIGLALAFAGLISLYLQIGMTAFNVASTIAWQTLNNYTMTAIPPFILMGELFAMIGIGASLFDSISAWISRIRGGIVHAIIVSSGVFSALSGSSMATAATVATIAQPEAEKRGYDSRLSLGAMAAGGTLGILIPPSLAAIIYSAITEESVGRLFLAGVLPGLLLIALFMLYVYVRCTINPNLAPLGEATSWNVKWVALWKLGPTILLIVVVLGSIFSGLATPTESAAVGAAMVAVYGLLNGKLTWKIFSEALMRTIQTTSMLLLLVVGAMIFTQGLSNLEVNEIVLQGLTGIENRYLALILIMLAYLILGCFIDGLSMLVMTIPVVYPAITAMGFNGIWFYVLYCIVNEMGYLTPPVGLNLFVLQGISGKSITDVTVGSMPYFACQGLALAIVLAFPSIATWLPSLMMD